MKKAIVVFLALVLIVSLCACGKKTEESTNQSSDIVIPQDNSSEEADQNISEMDFSFSDRDSKTDTEEEDIFTVSFGGTNATTDCQTVNISNGFVTITSAGTYILSGTATNGQIKVDATDEKVHLIFNSLSVTNASGPALYISQAKKVFVTLQEDTENTLTDSKTYGSEYDNADGCIFSKADLTLNGSGKLTVTGNCKHGIVSKDDLIITGGIISVTSVSSGMDGKDCVKISDGTITVNAGTNGIISSNEEDATKGYVYISGGDFNITAGNDGIQSATITKIEGGSFQLKTGTGSTGKVSGTESYKGIKAVSDVIISGGSFNLNTTDDAIHSNGIVSLSGGTIQIASGDDGIHADKTLTVSGGTITVTKSYEAMEGSAIVINDGTMELTASDDGLNAASSTTSSSGGFMGGGMMADSTSSITINGGYIYINASGDGIDSNNSIVVTGGVTLVSGPTSSADAAFDHDGTASVTGGILIALGSSGMAQNFDSAQNQGAILYNFTTQSANTSFAICNSDGTVLASFTPPKAYASATITAPGIQTGSTYTLVTGGTIANADSHGFATNSTVSSGKTLATISMSSLIYGSSGGMGGGGNNPGGGGGGMQPGKRW